MHSVLGCNHPTSALPWRTLLPLMALHLLRPGSAQLRVVAPSARVTAIVGQDVVLHCHLCSCKDAWSSDIRWIQHRSSGLVHHYQSGQDLEQMEEYKGRTELLRDDLFDGNLELRITAVRSSDSGSYICAVQDGDNYADAVVNLEVSDPFSQIVHPWKVALAVVIALLIGSFVINAFLLRKQVAQSRKLKRKDAELETSKAKMEILAEKLDRSDAKLDTLAEKLVRSDAKSDTPAKKRNISDAKSETPAKKRMRSDAKSDTPAEKPETSKAKMETPAKKRMRSDAKSDIL